ncbi:hypothetical protein OGATHE_006766 [Ogataea polymorpha]|uniref:Uncharacterized protein n=1 Tax=Ogataea polymorpha TaxID=460523 RepID=A0A9P8NSK1_9ASCO|nr:hypothetical protein OGATHE_006766 [Ogataea polymorpha]
MVTSPTFTTTVTLSPHTDSVTDFELGAIHPLAHSNDLANNFMTEGSWKWQFSPVALTGMNIRATDSTG